MTYVRFMISSIFYPLLAEIPVVLLIPPPLSLALVSLLLLGQTVPVVIPRVKAWQRRRAVEAELPFVGMLLFVLSHESFPNIVDAFSKIRELGSDVFPGMSLEASILQRNVTYGGTSEASAVESTFAAHPSEQFRSFLHGYLTALLTGREIHGFAREEAGRFVAGLEERWQGFARLTSSMTEVAFTLLSIFPVGIQMVATTFLNPHSVNLLLLSHTLLVGTTVGIIFLIDKVQPAIHDKEYSFASTALLVALWSSCSLLMYIGYLTPIESLIPPLSVSLLLVVWSRRHFRLLHAGESEVGLLLHDLAEESRAGASLPIALSRVMAYSARFPSTRESLRTFSTLLDLGYDPVAAQKRITHGSWLVRVSMSIMAVAFLTGGGYELLDRLSASFRRISDARHSLSVSILPFAVLGVFVPLISGAAVWLLSGIGSLGSFLPNLAAQSQGPGVALSISLTSLLSGLIVTKAYTLSLRNLVVMPPLIAATLVSLLIFGVR